VALNPTQAIGQALNAQGAAGGQGLTPQDLRGLGLSAQAIALAQQMFGNSITQQGVRLLQDEMDRQQALQQDPTQYLSDLYEEYLGRMPDSSGLATYLSPAVQKRGWDYIQQQIATSPEARRHGTPNRMWDPTGMAGVGPDQLGHMPQQDWSRLLDEAEAFAANTGWSTFPSAVDLYNLYRSGQWLDQQQANQWFTNNALSAEQRQRMPWAASGLSAQAYHQRRDQYLDSLETYTGNRHVPDQGVLDQALTEGWSSQRLLDHFLNDPAFQAQYGWTKYGMTYQGFQTYKLQNRQHIISRYGTSSAQQDAAYLSDLAQPLQAFSGQSAPTRNASQAPQYAGQSEIR
jgi:hypothetical protein